MKKVSAAFVSTSHSVPRLRELRTRFIAYYRVSTERQSRSGLGLEAQHEAVRAFINGKGWPPIAEFVEVESGKRNDRPELAKAIKACKLHGATLVIAKLDRLARNVAFVSSLMESGIEFTAVDFPQANRLTIHILAAVAEHEAAMISQRTKAALAAAKARGVRLGNPKGVGNMNLDPAKGAAARAAKADEFVAQVGPTIQELRNAGKSLRQIAAELTGRRIPTANGGAWTASSVSNVLSRLG